MIQIAIKATHNLDDCEDFCLRLLDKLDAEELFRFEYSIL